MTAQLTPRAQAVIAASDEYTAPIFRAPVGGEVGEAIAAGDGTLHGAIDFWQEKASYWKTRSAKAEANNAQSLECLIELKDRLELCIREGLSAYEAFDSFYAEMVDAAIAAATGKQS